MESLNGNIDKSDYLNITIAHSIIKNIAKINIKTKTPKEQQLLSPDSFKKIEQALAKSFQNPDLAIYIQAEILWGFLKLGYKPADKTLVTTLFDKSLTYSF